MVHHPFEYIQAHDMYLQYLERHQYGHHDHELTKWLLASSHVSLAHLILPVWQGQ